jgi:hypothetical protein
MSACHPLNSMEIITGISKVHEVLMDDWNRRRGGYVFFGNIRKFHI